MPPRPLVVIITVVLATALGCKKTVDTEGFSKNIEKRVREMGMTPDKAVCASGVEAKVGNVFTCQVFFGPKTYDIKATITTVDKSDIQLNLEWAGAPPVLTAKVTPIAHKALTDQLGAPATVDCGADPILPIENGTARCTVTAGKTTAAMVLKFDAKNDVQGWELDPKLLVKAKLEAALLEPVRAQTAPTVVVNCGPDDLIVRPADGNVLCDVTDGTTVRKIRVAVSPDLSVEKWESVP
jgi:hypothetical protein